MPTISITATGLNKALKIARHLASIESAMDMPEPFRSNVTVMVGGHDASEPHPVHVPWTLVQESLAAQREKLHQALLEMGIVLLPPGPVDPKEGGHDILATITHPNR